MKIQLPGVLFWLGVFCILLSFWIRTWEHQLANTGYLLIISGVLVAIARVAGERGKKK